MVAERQIVRQIWYEAYIYFIGVVYWVKEYFSSHRKLENLPKRNSDVVVITGGTRGIGLEALRGFLQSHLHVVLGCRDTTKGNELISRLREEGIKDGSAECIELDLTSLASVRKFANVLLERNQKVDILVNNAGIMFVPYEQTKDGYESHFHVNYLGHFLLTHLLMPLLKRSATSERKSRIVSVSSSAHWTGNINFADLHFGEFYSPQLAYSCSKLCQILFSKHLDAMLKEKSIPVQAVSLHPGIVLTELYEHTPIWKYFSFLARKFFKTPSQGADGLVYASLAPELEQYAGNGIYLENCQIVTPSSLALDVELQNKLWAMTLCLLDIKEFGAE